MPVGYDPLLGELRSTSGNLIIPQKPYFPGEPILHLPLRDHAKDVSPYQHQILNEGMLFTPDGWASGTLEFSLAEFDLSDLTLSANVRITSDDRADLFGINSENNGFFWEYRNGTRTVLETWNSSYDHNFDQAETGEVFHLTATLSGQIITIYVNGQMWDQTEWSSLSFPEAFFYIWEGWGQISDVRLYNICLSEAEVWDVYQFDRR